jgi:hypothetical protein
MYFSLGTWSTMASTKSGNCLSESKNTSISARRVKISGLKTFDYAILWQPSTLQLQCVEFSGTEMQMARLLIRGNGRSPSTVLSSRSLAKGLVASSFLVVFRTAVTCTVGLCPVFMFALLARERRVKRVTISPLIAWQFASSKSRWRYRKDSVISR